jgi:hypothetical protein
MATWHEVQQQYADHPILKTLDQEQWEKFVAFRDGLQEKVIQDKVISQQQWDEWRSNDILDDMCLYRFLYGYGWDVQLCIGVAIEMIEWIKTIKPRDIKLKDLEHIARSGHLFHYGHDRKDRPVLYLLSAKDVTENSEDLVKEKFKHIVHTVEKCIQDIKNPKETYRITWVVELLNGSISMSMVQTLKGHFDILGARYPERCAQILVLNPPWFASWAWSFVKPFLNKEMQDRYVFIRGSTDQVREQLLTYIAEDQLIPELYGGKAKFKFDFDRMVKEEK